jgi:uncharacterized membrane protein SpoIIM required for sporulation
LLFGSLDTSPGLRIGGPGGVKAPRCTAGFILAKNGLVGIRLLSGVALGGVPGVPVMLEAGAAVGSAVGRAIRGGTRSAVVVAAILPHGLIEYSAFILFLAIAFVPMELLILVYIRRPIDWRQCGAELIVGTSVAASGLVLAALVECNVTYALLQRAIG